jgi:hypothetical protein
VDGRCRSFSCLGGVSSNTSKKCIYLEVHASNALSSALSAEIKDNIEIEHGLLERANLLWKIFEKIFGSSNDKISSSTNILENIPSSYIHIDQDQEEQLIDQKEKVKSVSLGKLDGPVFQTRVSNFGRTKDTLAKEGDCSTSTSNVDDYDDTDDEYDDQEHLLEFQKLIRKHMKLQKRHGDLLCSHEKIIESYALLESTHDVMITMVKFSQPHTCTCAPHSIDLSCANSGCSQAKPSRDEHVIVKTCYSLIASENDELKR